MHTPFPPFIIEFYRDNIMTGILLETLNESFMRAAIKWFYRQYIHAVNVTFSIIKKRNTKVLSVITE